MYTIDEMKEALEQAKNTLYRSKQEMSFEQLYKKAGLNPKLLAKAIKTISNQSETVYVDHARQLIKL